MKRNDKPKLEIPDVAALDLAMRQRTTILHALEEALETCVTHESIHPHVVRQALDEFCAKILATVATHVRQERDDQLAYIEDAIQDVGCHTYDWLRALRGEGPEA